MATCNKKALTLGKVLNAILKSDYENKTDSVVLPPNGGNGNVTNIEEDYENVTIKLVDWSNYVLRTLELHRNGQVNTRNYILIITNNSKPNSKRPRKTNKPAESKPSRKKSDGTGTIHANRIMKWPLHRSKIISKKERGCCDYCLVKSFVIVQWKGDKVVYMGSITLGIEHMSKVKRYSQKAKMKINILQPLHFYECNKDIWVLISLIVYHNK